MGERKALIIGCGIAGPVAAMFLERVGIGAEIFEARSGPDDEAGAFLNLMPNGMNVLKTLGIHGEVAAHGFPSTGIAFFGARAKSLGQLQMGGEERYGVTPIVIRRGRLSRSLREAAERRGIEVRWGKKLVAVTDGGTDGVVARFEDGTEARGDFLLGCDGIHSRVRRSIFPAAREPVYTGVLDSGAVVRMPDVPPTGPVMRMYFGRRAFFGYTRTPTGDVYWFSNHHDRREPARGELDAIPDEAWKQCLLALHRGDPDPVERIIWNTDGRIGRWPIYDLPLLPRWHRGRVCLLGDAAHATSPHVGGGASLALEDAVVVAKHLRDAPDAEAAFAAFQASRYARVSRLVREARRTGNQKAVSNPVLVAIRDLVLPLFLKRASASSDWIHGYRVEWESPADGVHAGAA
ncbi:MAG TPA: FAD-dependent monooxygenase [Longimicrobiales bacterium]